jgi:hypothetical protein
VESDQAPVSSELRRRLREWQNWWEHMMGPALECGVNFVVNQGEWSRFVSDGRSLVANLQHELGDAVDVRLRYS